MSSLVEDFLSFLATSPTSWHCVKQVGTRLSLKDFHPLEEAHLWELEKGKKYFVPRGGSVAAFCLPQKPPARLVVMAAHTDSPGLKVKPHPDIAEQGMHLLQVETYGSPLLHSWLNRDLALAGRVFLTSKKGSHHESLVFLEDCPMTIPELAIHLQREVHDKGPLVNKQDHLNPLFALGHSSSFSLEKLLHKYLSFSSLDAFDLFLVPLEPPRLTGAEGEMIASYRIDNLTSVHAATSAIATYQDSEILPLAIFFDHEEIGSVSWEGACSSFLTDLLTRIKHFYHLSEEAFLALKRNSLCLSLDMAHGLNPMHSAKYDPSNTPLLGKGIALKSNAQLKYASSGETLAQASQICRKAGLKPQPFAARSDMPCGSTVGPFLTSSIGIPTVDLGCPQLSMHSCREVMAVHDYLDLYDFLTHALRP